VDNLEQLLALKRYEQPDGEYFAEFLREFQRRQRAELLRGRSWGMLWERLGSWFSDLGGVKWAYAGGAAYALLLAGLFFWPHEQARLDAPAAPVVHEVPVPVVIDEDAATPEPPAKQTPPPVEGEF
jgi:hypothetical protein